MFGYNVTQMVSVATGEDMHISCLVKHESIYRYTCIELLTLTNKPATISEIYQVVGNSANLMWSYSK